MPSRSPLEGIVGVFRPGIGVRVGARGKSPLKLLGAWSSLAMVSPFHGAFECLAGVLNELHDLTHGEVFHDLPFGD